MRGVRRQTNHLLEFIQTKRSTCFELNEMQIHLSRDIRRMIDYLERYSERQEQRCASLNERCSLTSYVTSRRHLKEMTTNLSSFECLLGIVHRMTLQIDTEHNGMIARRFSSAVRLPHWFDDADRETSQRARMDLIDIEGLQFSEMNLILFQLGRIKTNVEGPIAESQVEKFPMFNVGRRWITDQGEATRKIYFRLLI